MKLKTTLGQRRDGSLPKITIPKGRGAVNIEANDKGEYDVPNDMAQDLIDTGNFIDPTGKLTATAKPENAGRVIVNPETGDKADLDAMTKDELVLFALDNFGEELDKRKSKAELIDAILVAVQKASESDEDDE